MTKSASNSNLFLLYYQPLAAGGLAQYASHCLSVLAERGSRCIVASHPLGLELAAAGKNQSFRFIGLDRVAIASRSGLPSSLQVLLRRALLFANPVFFVVNFFGQYRMLRKIQPSACIAINGGHSADESCLSLIIAARFANVPVALMVLGTPRRRRGLLYFYDLMLDKCLCNASIVITNANHISQNLRRFRGAGTRPIMLIRNPAPFTAARKSHNKSASGGSKLVVVSRVEQGKGLFTLVKAISILDKESVSELHIIGGGSLRASLENLVTVLGIANRVTFHGEVSELEKRRVMNFANIAVAPSEREGLSYWLLEAMASGLPVVCSAVPGNLEIITHRREALTFPAGQPFGLARVIGLIHDDQDLGRTLADNAKTRLEAIGYEARFRRDVEEALEILVPK